MEHQPSGGELAVISRSSVLAILVFSACTSSVIPADVGTDQPDSLDSDTTRYVAIDGSEFTLQPFEEDWCNRLEGRAGGWLIADESELVVDVVSGEPFWLDPESRGLLVTIASEGAAGVTPDELAQLDTLLRLPVPSALACRTAYEARDR